MSAYLFSGQRIRRVAGKAVRFDLGRYGYFWLQLAV